MATMPEKYMRLIDEAMKVYSVGWLLSSKVLKFAKIYDEYPNGKNISDDLSRYLKH
jgi:hypothetical protein